MRLIAAAKGISTEEINIHLKMKPDWYLSKINSVGKVPTIQLLDGRVIRESLVAAGRFVYLIILTGYICAWTIALTDTKFEGYSIAGKDTALKLMLENKPQGYYVHHQCIGSKIGDSPFFILQSTLMRPLMVKSSGPLTHTSRPKPD